MAIHESDTWDDDTLEGPDEADLEAGDDGVKLQFENFVEACPACGKPVADDMDCCPYCGDIIFRHLRHGTFAPKRGPFVRIFAFVVVAVVILGSLAFLLAVLGGGSLK